MLSTYSDYILPNCKFSIFNGTVTIHSGVFCRLSLIHYLERFMARKQRVNMDVGQYESQPEPLGKRVGRFIILVGIVFAISAGVVVTQRLSEDALALMVGLSCGIAAMLPTVLLGGFWLKRELNIRKSVQRLPEQTALQPPVIVVTPQTLPGYGQASAAALSAPVPSQWQPVNTAREFKIVGGLD
jgi:hypothetical protein